MRGGIIMRGIVCTVVVSVLLLSVAYINLNAKAEDTDMQLVTKITRITTQETVEFRIKLLNRQQLSELIPSIRSESDEQFRQNDYPYMKYLFCNVKNIAKRGVLFIKFRITSPNAHITSPVIEIPGLSPSGKNNYPGEYVLVYLGNPYFGIPDADVKFDVEIVETIWK